jgi:hypothetical protein
MGGNSFGRKITLEPFFGQLPKIGAGWSSAVLNIASVLRYDERFLGEAVVASAEPVFLGV